MPPGLYRSNLLAGLTELSDVDFQRRVWLADSGPEVSSFDEARCHAYDDSGLSTLLEKPPAEVEKELGLKTPQLLRELAAKLAKVNTAKPVAELIESAEMDQVRALAGQARHIIERM